MKQLCTIFIFLAFTTFVSAQSNFIEGYLIMNENDTLSGWINFKSDQENMHQCEFKTAEDALLKIYKPGEIFGYRLTEAGKFYISQTIELEGISRTVFLEFLIQGMMNLYFYKDGDNSYYFFKDENGDIYPLTQKKEEIIGNKWVKVDTRYKGRLFLIFQENQKMRKNINAANFDKVSMIKLTKEFHELTCTDGSPCIEFENDYKKKFAEIKYSVYAAMTRVNYIVDYILPKDKNNLTEFFPGIGVQMDISNPRFSKNLSVLFDVSFSDFHLKNNSSDPAIIQHIKYYQTYSIDAFMMLTGDVGLRYTYYNKGKLYPFVEAGFHTTYLPDVSNYYKDECYNVNGELLLHDEWRNLYVQNWFTGFSIGTGIKYRIYREHTGLLGIRYDYASYIGHYSEVIQDRFKNLSVRIGYTF
jgi:hypothetical protein